MTTSSRTYLPWLVWGVAVAAYVIAIINRSSLASLGTATQQHFGIDATQLGSFAMIQLVVYAAMQIPVGVLLDRFGPSAVILAGSLLMSLGQLVMATVHDVNLAIFARVLIGAGDACSFISVMRLLPDWFSVRQLPVIGQLTGLVGQAGQLISVTPLALIVDRFGWITGFSGIAAVGLIATILVFLVVRDRPGQGTLFERFTGRLGSTSRNARSLGVSDSTAVLAAVAPPETSMIPTVHAPRYRVPGVSYLNQARRLLSIPGVRLAYWVHFTLPFPISVFVLLWGSPFLTGAVGVDQATASGLLSLLIISIMVGGVLLGPLSSRFVEKRVWIAFGTGVLVMLTWLLMLLWPGVPPLWLLAAVMVVTAIGGPASMIAFEIGRSHTPRSFAGFATGLINTGGFTAALIAIFLVGVLLDLQGAGSPENYSLSAFRWAFAAQVPFWVLGLLMILIEHHRTAKWMRKHHRKLR